MESYSLHLITQYTESGNTDNTVAVFVCVRKQPFIEAVDGPRVVTSVWIY
jgi:hypothetical protein